MTRAPVVAFPSVCEVVECMAWLESKKGFAMLRDAFNETSSHADLLSIFPNPVVYYMIIASKYKGDWNGHFWLISRRQPVIPNRYSAAGRARE
ncbi:unnamed protein product [Schistocephalus solidus]|uniref:Uncharacterized protein n=1 Tax=Schistocephalus solidus TaxID=70667 RepID=A0A183SBT2_SCHSO|nr:unnamed protein product [Schistocephalus solidus]